MSYIERRKKRRKKRERDREREERDREREERERSAIAERQNGAMRLRTSSLLISLASSSSRLTPLSQYSLALSFQQQGKRFSTAATAAGAGAGGGAGAGEDGDESRNVPRHHLTSHSSSSSDQYDYHLPENLIADRPITWKEESNEMRRDTSRLLCIDTGEDPAGKTTRSSSSSGNHESSSSSLSSSLSSLSSSLSSYPSSSYPSSYI